jgi:hypothetical protein
MPWGRRLLGLRLPASIVQRTLEAMARLAVMVGVLGWCGRFRLAPFEPVAADHKEIFQRAVWVADIANGHVELFVCPEPSDGVTAKEELITKRICRGHLLGRDGNFFEPKGSAGIRLARLRARHVRPPAYKINSGCVQSLQQHWILGLE